MRENLVSVSTTTHQRLRAGFRRRLAPVLLGAAALGLHGCATTGESTTASGLSMEIRLDATSATATAVPSTQEDYAWTVTFSVTLSETGGVGGTITAIQAVLNEASGGIEVVTSGEVVKTGFGATTNRLDALSSVEIPVTINYTLPGGGHEALVDLAVQVYGDDDVTYTAYERVSVS